MMDQPNTGPSAGETGPDGDGSPSMLPPGTVLQVLPSLTTGGVERGTVDIARAQVEAGLTALVASSGGAMVRELERAGASHITLPLHSKNPAVMWANIGRLATVIRDHGVDIVHARSRAPAWSARAAAKRTGARFVTTFHGTYGAGSPAKRAYNAIMARGERVIAISEFIAAHAVTRYRAAPDRLRVIPRGIDLDAYTPAAIHHNRIVELAETWRLPDGAPVIMLPGRLTRWKGQLVLVEAVARLRRRDIVCLLVGDDQGRIGYRREIEDLIARLGLEGVVRVTGPCADMPAAYMLADVVVSASTDPEAFGRVAVEAQAMGRPVIATDHGASRETVLAGRTGWLVPPGDAEALSAALAETLALESDTRAALARAGAAHVAAHFSRADMCQATLDVYAELMAERPHP